MIPSAGFGIEHLPYGVVVASDATPRVAVRLGDVAVDLPALVDAGLIPALRGRRDVVAAPTLDGLLRLGPSVWSALRGELQALLAADRCPPGARHDLAAVTTRLPVAVADLVDGYCSLDHVRRVGGLWRRDDPVPANWRHLPAGYHGRAGTVVVSGTPVRRPVGQLGPRDDGTVEVGPTRRLDAELELAAVVGVPTDGGPVDVTAAGEHIFGVALLNDWSARDIQAWEYRPLGPFVGKAFATSLAAWITPMAALAPFLVTPPPREPAPPAYLRPAGTLPDLALAWSLRPDGGVPTTVGRSRTAELYWTAAQQLAHLPVRGARLRVGDVVATGTVSGAADDACGCLLEATLGGREPVRLVDGGSRTWLLDGDEVTLTGASPDGRVRLAPVTGRILPA